MTQASDVDEWTTRIVRDPAFRKVELRRAGVVERLGSLIAAALGILAVWGHTAGSLTVGGIGAPTIGGMATLSFAAMMAIAASGGIRRRIIFLASEVLSADGRSSADMPVGESGRALRTP